MTDVFLDMPHISVPVLCELVATYAPGHHLRNKRGLNVRVGAYTAPPGGPNVEEQLTRLLVNMNDHRGAEQAWRLHVAREICARQMRRHWPEDEVPGLVDRYWPNVAAEMAAGLIDEAGEVVPHDLDTGLAAWRAWRGDHHG